MTEKLQGKVALVTGGSSGIGRAAAVAFAREGARVVIAARGVPRGEETVEAIRRMGGEAIFVKTDVSTAAEVEALIEKAVETYGRLDYALNSAGVEDALMPTAECSEENWDRVINTNLKGAWLCMKYEIHQMLKQGGGAIVNVTSPAGLRGFPGMPAYSASKGGVIQLTRTAALEYAKANIRINVICPGGVRTPMTKRIMARARERGMAALSSHPLERIAEPEEMAGAIVWLCSEATSFVIGHTLVLDGGWTVQ